MSEMEGYMEDAKGRLVPDAMIKDIDRARHDLVMELAGRALALQQLMINFKNDAFGDIAAFVDLSAEKYGVKMGGKKGNISLVSFDGKCKIQVAVAEHLVFDERLQLAKQLIDECITEWAEGSRDEIKTLVNDAFQVDKEGRISTGRVLGLRRLDITHEKWIAAMQAISESVQVVGSKTYFRIYERCEADNKFKPIALDLAAI